MTISPDSVDDANASAVQNAYELQVAAFERSERGDIAGAIECYSKARHAYLTLDMMERVADCALSEGSLQTESSPEEARRVLGIALETYQSLGLPYGVGRCEEFLAFSANSQGDNHAAVEHYVRAYTAYSESGSTAKAADAMYSLGSIFSTMGDQKRARQCMATAREHFMSTGSEPDIALCTYHIGIANMHLGDFALANNAFTGARETFSRLGDVRHVAECDLYRADLLIETEAFDDALAVLARAQETFQALDLDDMTASCDFTRGRAFLEKGDFESARKYTSSALDAYMMSGEEEQVAACELNLGLCYQHMEDFEQALQYLGRARTALTERGRNADVADCNNNIGNCYRHLGNHDLAIAHLRLAIEGYQQLGMVYEQVRAAWNLGIVVLRSPDYAPSAAPRVLELWVPLLVYVDHQRIQFADPKQRFGWSSRFASVYEAVLDLAAETDNAAVVYDLITQYGHRFAEKLPGTDYLRTTHELATMFSAQVADHQPGQHDQPKPW